MQGWNNRGRRGASGGLWFILLGTLILAALVSWLTSK